MILYLEVAMTFVGLFFLIAGRTFGKNEFSHPHIRLLGGFLLTLIPVAVGAVLLLSIVWGLTHSNQTIEEAQNDLRWPAMGLEAAIALTYVGVAILWEKSLRRKAMEREAERVR